MTEDFRPVDRSNGAGDLGFTARVEFETAPDAALDQLVTLMTISHNA